MVDLDSNPTKLIEIVEIGKQPSMTRGSLTTFLIANDVAKYSRFRGRALRRDPPVPDARRHAARSSQSVILTAIIFNALIIIASIPWR